MNKAEIITIKRFEIKHKKRKKDKYPFYLIVSLVIFLVLFCSGYVGDFRYDIVHAYNPINSLYSDTGEIVFTSSGLVEKTSVNMSIPILCENYEIEDGNILFTVGKSIMVKSPEDGVVVDVGTTIDGVKYIKIRHTQDIYSVIENLDIIGVGVDDVIKKGKDIATAISGSCIKLRIYSGDKQINNLNIKQSRIVWED